DELVEVDIVPDVEADVQRSGVGGARVLVRRRETGTTALRLLPVAILQELDDPLSNWTKRTSSCCAPPRRSGTPIVRGLTFSRLATMSSLSRSVLWMRSPWKSPSRITSVPPRTSV